MDQNKTIVKRIGEEWNDFKIAPLKIKIIVSVTIIIWFFFAYNEIIRIPAYKNKVEKLEKENEQKNEEILRLETQLTPFRTFALQKYPGDEREALRKLSIDVGELQKKIEQVENTINNFEVRVEVKYFGVWTSGKVPATPGIIAMEAIPRFILNVIETSGDIKKLCLFVKGMGRITDLGDGKALLTYHREAQPGEWILGIPVNNIRSFHINSMPIYGINSTTTQDGFIVIDSIKVEIFINNVKRFRYYNEKDQRLQISGQNPSILWNNIDGGTFQSTLE